MSKILAMLLGLAAFAPSAIAATMASQPWTTNRIAEAEARMSAQISGKADASNVYTKAETDVRIVELAPTPGDYATVSNRAMSAIQSLQPATNYADSIAASFENGMRTAAMADTANFASESSWASRLGGAGDYSAPTADDLIRASTNAAEAVTAAALGNLGRTYLPRQHSAEGETASVGFDYGPGGLAFVPSSIYSPSAYFETFYLVTADERGPLSAIGQYSPDGKTARQEVEDTIREKSLGGIWDAELEVWWTPRMKNGSLTYEATTNVNLNAEN